MTTVFGTRKSDLLHDGPDSTTFYGKGGFDVFHFNDLAVDKIRDFNVNKDTIVINHSAFAAIIGSVPNDQGGDNPVYAPKPEQVELVYGGWKAAQDPGFAYNPRNGKVWYDMDGQGDIKAILIAKIGKGLDLTEDNLVIA